MFQCKSCGGQFTDDDYVIAGFCPDCGIGELMYVFSQEDNMTTKKGLNEILRLGEQLSKIDDYNSLLIKR